MFFYQTDNEDLQIPDFSYGSIPILTGVITSHLVKDSTKQGTNTYNLTTPADTTERIAIIMTTIPQKLRATSWPSGQWDFTVKVTNGDSNLDWEKIVLHRIATSNDDSGGVSKESISINVGTTLTTGVHTHNAVGVAAFTETAREDLLCVVMTVKNKTASSSSIQFQMNQTIQTPIVKRWRASQIVAQVPSGASLPLTFYGPPVDIAHCQTPMTKGYCFSPSESLNVIIESYMERAAKSGDDPPHRLFPLDSDTWTKVSATSTSSTSGVIKTQEFVQSDVSQEFIRPAIDITFNSAGAVEIVCELWVDQEWYLEQDPIFGEADDEVDPISHQMTDDYITQSTTFKDLTA